uniref:Uncharacterized protein n=1 Tax=Timema tahoe TaxID=61484 RepID=A0A7R9P0U3_9NEOP|nr:unnamed protein product [Timema tahoe]
MDDQAFSETFEKMKEDIGDSYFWAIVDETTDRCGRYIANIVVGKLDSTGPSSMHLITSRVIQTFDEEDAVSIREAKIATSSSTAVSDLAYVKSYFGNLPGAIVSLEARDLPLIESVKIMHTIQESVKQAPGPVASSIATKLEQVLQRNPGGRTMGAVSEILGGQSTPLQEIRCFICPWPLSFPYNFPNNGRNSVKSTSNILWCMRSMAMEGHDSLVHV